MVKITTKPPVGRFSGLFARIISSGRTSISLLVSMLVIILFYRIQLTLLLYKSPLKPFDFSPADHPVWFAIKYLPGDFATVLVFFLVVVFFGRMARFLKQGRTLRFLKISGHVFLQIFLMSLVLVHGLHGRLLFEGQTGLDWEVMREGLANVSLTVIVGLMVFKDFLFIFLPIGLFWLVFLSPARVRRWVTGVSFACIACLAIAITSLAAGGRGQGRGDAPDEIRLNPAAFFLSNIAGRMAEKQSVAFQPGMGPSEGEAGMQLPGSVHLSSSPFKGEGRRGMGYPLKFLPARRTEPWNIIFFVMESVGTRYIFDADYGSPMPMPFLHRLSKEGWYLRRHFTTSNLSTKALFPLLSGLYDSFGQESFGLRPEAAVPTLYDFMPPGYDAFLITPAPLSWFFPNRLIRNSGLPEIHSYENLDLKVREEIHPSLGRYVARDEVQTVDFLIQRLSKAREPFMGIYVSYVAHFPYFDYGPDFRVREKDDRLINHYYNNLNLLDQMIKRIYDHLEKEGKLERTILVVVGDHGQAFGQHHSDNFMHFRYSYNENLECPAILYQPGLFAPRVFDFPTSHVDLLPTLLDAMRIPYHPALFDGESLFQHKLRRKYLYFYGYEGSISSLGSDLIKVQHSLKKDRCWAFNLRVDPDERIPLDCSAYQPQLEALHQFVRHHNSSLVEYNASVRENRDFHGYRHPALR